MINTNPQFIKGQEKSQNHTGPLNLEIICISKTGANNKILKIDDQQQISDELILAEGWGYRTCFAVDQKGRIYVPTP